MAELPSRVAVPASTNAPQLEDAEAAEALHELRVRIPDVLHRQLLSLKVLRGKSLAETVSRALDLYFEENARLVEENPRSESKAAA